MFAKTLVALVAVLGLSLGGYSIYASTTAPAATDCCAAHEACCEVNAPCCGENFNAAAEDCCVADLKCCGGGACCK